MQFACHKADPRLKILKCLLIPNHRYYSLPGSKISKWPTLTASLRIHCNSGKKLAGLARNHYSANRIIMNPRQETIMLPPQAVAVPSRFILLPIRVFTAVCLLVGLFFATRSHAQQSLVAKNVFSGPTALHMGSASKETIASNASIVANETKASHTAITPHKVMTPDETPSSVYAIYPSTVKKNASVIIEAARDEWATLRILDMSGEIVLEQQMAVSKGTNKVPVFFISGLEKGKYATMLLLEDKLYFAPIVKE